MKKSSLHQVIKDFKYYLDGIEKMTKKCSPEQKAHLANILGSLLTVLVGFRKGTHMGEMIINWKDL